MIIQYYSINEELARRAKEMNSFYDYKEGSATEEYRRSVDAAARIAAEQKRKVDPIHHERIDRLLDTYARRLAENINRQNAIAARVPSILIAGGSNFPVRKKEKQNQASDAAMKEWQEIQGLLNKIRGTGKGGISADDPEAVQKLKLKLESLERDQESMKAVNAYYRKHKTLEGCPGLDPVQIEKLKASMARDWRKDPKSTLTRQQMKLERRAKRLYALAACFLLALTALAVPAFAADDPLAVVQNLSDFIFSLIRAVGLILLGYGILQVGLSFQSHDPSQRSNGILTIAGGIVITFTKEILTLITG